MVTSSGPVTAAAPANSSGLALAARTDTLGVGFSGSGFLIFYFTGVTAILKQLGIITSKTRVAGASGGSINAALTCSSMPLQQQYTDLSKLASMCRPARGCAGSLDKEVEAALRNALPADAAQLCSGRLWVSITAATPQNRSDENVLLGSSWKSNAELISAARLSSFIPGFSGGSATKQLPEVASVGNAYDGGFSQNLPCPPGVRYCVKVASVPWDPSVSQDALQAIALMQFNGFAASAKAGALTNDSNTAPFIPLNPIVIPTPKPDIYPGLSKPLPVNATTWSSYALNIPDAATLRSIFDIGRQDAAAWAMKQGLASLAAADKALNMTQVKA